MDDRFRRTYSISGGTEQNNGSFGVSNSGWSAKTTWVTIPSQAIILAPRPIPETMMGFLNYSALDPAFGGGFPDNYPGKLLIRNKWIHGQKYYACFGMADGHVSFMNFYETAPDLSVGADYNTSDFEDTMWDYKR